MNQNFQSTHCTYSNHEIDSSSDLDLSRLTSAKERIRQQNVFSCREIGIDLLCSPIFQRHREEISSFGYSIRSFLLYAQVGDRQSRAPGLFLEQGDISFALGLFLRDGIVSAHIISPHGDNWQQAVGAFSTGLRRNKIVDLVYVRQLRVQDAVRLESYDFKALDTFNAWCKHAPFEDETFNHRIVTLRNVVDYQESRGLIVKNLKEENSIGFNKKFRLAFQRGMNFLARNGLTYSLRPFEVEDLVEVQTLVSNHFDVLEQSGKAIGSCALDYELLLQNLLTDSARYVSLVGVLESGENESIVSIFLAERTGANTGGLYCSITSRSEERFRSLLRDADLTGFSALSQYAYAKLFGELVNRGWESVDLGGSETSDLDRFKRQMNARPFETTWRVM